MTRWLVTLALAALFAGPGEALTLAFYGSVEGSQTPFEGQAFHGTACIDLEAPVVVQGDSRNVVYIPQGSLELELGPLSFSETITAVSASQPRGGGALFLSIIATPLRPASLSSVSLAFTPAPGEDPFLAATLGTALDAVRTGCCAARLSFTTLTGPAVTTPANLAAAVPEPGAFGVFALGLALVALRIPLPRSRGDHH